MFLVLVLAMIMGRPIFITCLRRCLL